MTSIDRPLFETLESRLFLDAAPGVFVLDAANPSATVTFLDGTTIQARLAGRIDATASVELTATADGFEKIELAGTTEGNSLTLTSQGRQAFDIGEVTFLDGADLANFKAPDGDLNGAGMTGDAGTNVSRIQLGDLANGADVNLPSAGVAKGVTLQFDSVGDEGFSEIITGSGIRSFRTRQWDTGNVFIDAPWVRNLTVTDGGKRSLSLSGPTDAGMHMTIVSFFDGVADRWLDNVILTGTTGRNTLNIRSQEPAVALGAIALTGNADLRAINAPTTVLTGVGLTGEADCEVATVSLNALVYGADINLLSADVAQGINLTLRAVGTNDVATDGDGSDVVLGSGIRSFRAQEWLGAGSVWTPWINTFYITGQRNAVYGRMTGDVNLTDHVAGRRYGLTTFRVAGLFVGSLNLGENDARTITVGSWGHINEEEQAGNQVIEASTIQSLQVRGYRMFAQDQDLTGATGWRGMVEGVSITLSGTDARGYSMRTMKVANTFYRVDVQTAGHIGTFDVGMIRETNLFIGCDFGNAVNVELEDEGGETWTGKTIDQPSLLGQGILTNFIVRNVPDAEFHGPDDSGMDWTLVPSLSFTSIAGASVRNTRITDDFVTANEDKRVDLGSTLFKMDLFSPVGIRSSYRNDKIDVSREGEKARPMKLSAKWSPTRGSSGSLELTSLWEFI